MIEDILPRLVPYLLLGLFMVWTARRVSAEMKAATDRHIAGAEAKHQELMAELRREREQYEAEAATRQAAWEAEQAALDAAEQPAAPAR